MLELYQTPGMYADYYTKYTIFIILLEIIACFLPKLPGFIISYSISMVSTLYYKKNKIFSKNVEDIGMAVAKKHMN